MFIHNKNNKHNAGLNSYEGISVRLKLYYSIGLKTSCYEREKKQQQIKIELFYIPERVKL